MRIHVADAVAADSEADCDVQALSESPAQMDAALGVYMTQPYIDKELEALIPAPFAITPDESDRPTGALLTHLGHDPRAVADANLERFIINNGGIGTIVVSAGPWREGAIVDGCRRFRLAEKLGLKAGTDYKVEERTFANATEAKRFAGSQTSRRSGVAPTTASSGRFCSMMISKSISMLWRLREGGECAKAGAREERQSEVAATSIR